MRIPTNGYAKEHLSQARWRSIASGVSTSPGEARISNCTTTKNPTTMITPRKIVHAFLILVAMGAFLRFDWFNGVAVLAFGLALELASRFVCRRGNDSN